MTNTNSIKTGLSFAKIAKKTYILGILTASTLGLVPFTAQANPNPCCQSRGGDNAVIQTSNQQATVKGKGNSINQNSSQSNYGGRSQGTGNQGVVQDQYQEANSHGYGNRVDQTARQSNGNQNQFRRPVHRPSSCNNTCAKKGI
ncbi:hypothetical protein [Argonema galeatum]|uniref:hypothetical protein n=1 Tax=Argonema galeatum TaxID=2942762 RepID=UPI0020130CE9|nr:hypothetical protein [Argonema galeatum]MCL1467829.1 hypothetical protein [Argonema galeatum A003/A1]